MAAVHRGRQVVRAVRPRLPATLLNRGAPSLYTNGGSAEPQVSTGFIIAPGRWAAIPAPWARSRSAQSAGSEPDGHPCRRSRWS